MHPSKPRTSTAVRALSRAGVAVLITALGLLGAGPVSAAPANDDVPWAVRTASNNFGSHRQNYSYTINPGGRLEDGLLVVNHGTALLDLAVYTADAFTTDTGRLDIRTKTAASTGVGAWVHADRDRLRLRPGESVAVPFTVTVPANATPGDHMGGIVTSLTQTESEGTNVERRVAIRIHLRVGGELKPRLSIKDLSVHYSGTPNPLGTGGATVTYTIHNTGNAILSARQSVSVSGPIGRFRVHSDQIADSPQLLPAETWKISVPVHEVAPALRLTATVTLVPLLTDASGSTAPLAVAKATTHASAIPWTLLVVVLCALAVVVLAYRRWRQTKRHQGARVQDDAHHAADLSDQ